MRPTYFKIQGRYYFVQSFQFSQSGPDADLGAVVLRRDRPAGHLEDQGSGPDPGARSPGGFHNIFAYKHSDGRALLFTTTQSPHANVYDMDQILAGDPTQGLVGRILSPDPDSA